MKYLLLLILMSSCASYQGPQEYKVYSNISYGEKGNDRQEGDIYVPEGKGPFPGVVLVHGGGWSSRSRTDMDNIAKSLVGHGFVVYNINYRLSPKVRHPSPINDLEMALEKFKSEASKYQLDVKRIGLWGYSSGGHTTTYYALTRAHDSEKRVQAVVAGGAPHDFTWYPHSPYIKKYTSFYRDQNLDLYFDASTVNHITKDAPPFFLYHAEKDRLVEWAQSQAFAARLKKQGIEVSTHTIGFWGHTLAFVFANEPIEKGVKFLKSKLRP